MKSEQGFSLLELIFSMGLISFAIATMSSSFSFQMKTNYSASVLARAVVAAENVINELRFDDISNMPQTGSDTTRTETVDGVSFSVDVEYCVDTGRCNASDMRQVVVSVSLRGDEKYVTEAIIADF